MKHHDLHEVARAIQRAETPYILFPDDISLSFHLNLDEARSAIRRGLFGAWFAVNGEPAILRETLRKHLGTLMGQRAPWDRELLSDDSTESRTATAPDSGIPEEDES
jgi:hypothetical protein